MSKIFWVDLPDPDLERGQRDGEDTSWINVKTYKSKGDALQFLFNTYGILRKYADCFISEGDDGE